jgi:hypothetical protein
MNTNTETTGLALLRKPFPPHQISKLPKPKSKDAPKGKCSECGGWHGLPAVHLDYVGHAALTDRLLDADPAWTWEPLSVSPDGLPVLDTFGGMWIKLTVCGVTRLGYGHAGDKHGGDAIKEVIGDALRNAAMRFGAALDLWHKGDLHAAAEERGDTAIPEPVRKENGRLPGVGVHKGTDGMLEALPEDMQLDIRLVASVLPGIFEKQGIEAAFDKIESKQYENDEKVALWGLLDSKIRSALKREGEKRHIAARNPAIEAGLPAH